MDRFQDGEIVLDVVISGIFKSIGVYQSVTSEHIERAKRRLTTTWHV